MEKRECFVGCGIEHCIHTYLCSACYCITLQLLKNQKIVFYHTQILELLQLFFYRLNFYKNFSCFCFFFFRKTYLFVLVFRFILMPFIPFTRQRCMKKIRAAALILFLVVQFECQIWVEKA